MRHLKVFGPERVEDEVFSLANWGSNKALALIQYSSWVIILNIFLQKTKLTLKDMLDLLSSLHPAERNPDSWPYPRDCSEVTDKKCYCRSNTAIISCDNIKI